MAKLSPDTQVLLDAYEKLPLNSRQWQDGHGPRLKIAAVLRALVFEVVEPSCPPSDPLDIQDDLVRSELADAIIAMAEELEDFNG